MSRLLLIAALFVVAAQAQVTYNPFSFCQRYAQALFYGKNATTEDALIRAVVVRAAAGGVPSVTGLFFHPVTAPFFNGTLGTNYVTNAANQATLVQKLVDFFQTAMLCRDMPAATIANQQSVHAGMKITKLVWDTFVGQLVATLASFGVPAGPEVTYAGNLLAQFLKGGNQVICNQPDCADAMDYAEYTSGSINGSPRWIGSQDQTDANGGTVTVKKGGNIHWNIGTAHNVIETDSTYTAKSSPAFTSGNPGATNVLNFNVGMTDTTYYFVCTVHPTMKGKIIVGTGGGSGSGAASVSASLAVVVAAVVGALALRF
jgi:plastocyanin